MQHCANKSVILQHTQDDGLSDDYAAPSTTTLI